MQPAQHQGVQAPSPAVVMMAGALSPSAMAQHLRRAGGPAALCFAQAMHDDAAWANEAWGRYWADVVRAV